MFSDMISFEYSFTATMGMSADCMAYISFSMYTRNTLLAEHFSSVLVDAVALSAIMIAIGKNQITT